MGKKVKTMVVKCPICEKTWKGTWEVGAAKRCIYCGHKTREEGEDHGENEGE